MPRTSPAGRNSHFVANVARGPPREGANRVSRDDPRIGARGTPRLRRDDRSDPPGARAHVYAPPVYAPPGLKTIVRWKPSRPRATARRAMLAVFVCALTPRPTELMACANDRSRGARATVPNS